MVAPLVMAGNLGLRLLPVIGAVSGAAPGLSRGNLGEAALGAGIGAFTGGTSVGPLKGLTKSGMRFAGSPRVVGGATNLLGQIAPDLVDAPIRQGLVQAARVGIPLAGVAGTAKLASMGGGGGSGTASPSLGGAAGLLGYNTIGNEGMGGVPLPPGMGPYGNIGPTGLPLDVLSPLGLEAGQRLRTQKDAQSLRDATNIVLPTIRKYAEQAKKDDFARSIATRGIAQNIATNAMLTQGMAQATRQLGTTGAQQAGEALTRQYNY
tara:strand:+ start:1208 stop:1999 length:792 start_codon:yes stop_codon:yes gene_type:complete